MSNLTCLPGGLMNTAAPRSRGGAHDLNDLCLLLSQYDIELKLAADMTEHGGVENAWAYYDNTWGESLMVVRCDQAQKDIGWLYRLVAEHVLSGQWDKKRRSCGHVNCPVRHRTQAAAAACKSQSE